MPEAATGREKAMPREIGHGTMEGGKLKIAIAFEPKDFARIQHEAEDRGASISEHVAWLVTKCWRLDQEKKNRDQAEQRLTAALREREKRRK